MTGCDMVVIGASGNLGRSIMSLGFSRGLAITGLYRRAAHSCEENHSLPPSRHWEDVEDLAQWLSAHKPREVVHAAGSASVSRSFDRPREDFLANVDAAGKVLEAIRKSGSHAHFTLLSSAAVYGNPSTIPTPENVDLTPISPYGYSKRIAELLVEQYATQLGVRSTILRVFSILSPNQRRLLPFEIAEQALSGGHIVLRGSGAETRDYLHADDLAEAIFGLSERRVRPHIEIFNLASGKAITVAHLAKRIRDMLDPKASIQFLNQPSGGDPSHWQADISALQRQLPSWRPRSLDEALKDCLKTWAGPRCDVVTENHG